MHDLCVPFDDNWLMKYPHGHSTTEDIWRFLRTG